jgi:hypothetical protein
MEYGRALKLPGGASRHALASGLIWRSCRSVSALPTSVGFARPCLKTRPRIGVRKRGTRIGFPANEGSGRQSEVFAGPCFTGDRLSRNLFPDEFSRNCPLDMEKRDAPQTGGG